MLSQRTRGLDEDLSSVAALGEEVNQLHQAEGEPEMGSELATTGTSNSIYGTSIWYHGRYPLHRRPSLCVQADPKREPDEERQLQGEQLPKSGQENDC